MGSACIHERRRFFPIYIVQISDGDMTTKLNIDHVISTHKGIGIIDLSQMRKTQPMTQARIQCKSRAFMTMWQESVVLNIG